MTLREEFTGMIEKCDKVYIFGTGKVADRLYDLIKAYDGNDKRILGFVVSEDRFCKQDKPRNVYKAGGILDLSVPFLVTVNKVYHPEVFELLEKIGAKIIEAHKFFMLELANNNRTEIGKYVFDYDNGKLTKEEAECRDKLLELCRKYCQAFGENKFYQSFPRLKLEGERPTDVRMKKYVLEKYLSKDADVLDIGANDGFIDMEISSNVSSVLGIEYNEKLVEIAQTAKKMLKIDNADFICDDYNHWKAGNWRKFDVIFSFAIHVWIGTSPEEYAKDIFKMLKKNGILFFESQTLESDIKYADYCKAFEDTGLERIREDNIMDDGKTNRKFTIYRKKL